jgi:hypothetical protein
MALAVLVSGRRRSFRLVGIRDDETSTVASKPLITFDYIKQHRTNINDHILTFLFHFLFPFLNLLKHPITQTIPIALLGVRN